jgi:S-(hydroxymethyl)glutathione dehydrogenase/alcohol dehydrogenase
LKAAVLYEVGKHFQVDDFKTPSVADDEVLMRVAACGMCHTDLLVLEGTIPARLPAVIGHEVSGLVERVGRLYQSAFREGQRVIVGMRYKCGHCRYCLAGRESLCRNQPTPSPLTRPNGNSVPRWNVGGFAQYVTVPGYMVFGVPEGVGLEEACILGCRVTTAYNAVKNGAHLEPGDSALVIGCGGIGLNTLQFLRLFGAYPIIAVDVLDEKLEAAKRFGATHTINAKREDPVAAVRSLTDGGVEKAFEAIGNVKTADQAVGATRPGGTAVIIGGLGPGPFTISDGRFPFNEVKVTGVAMRRATDVVEVLTLASQRRIQVEQLISKRYGFQEINEAVEDLRAGRVLMGVTVWN